MKANGVELGPNSPLRSASGSRRRFGPSEADDQMQLLELLVGPAKPGQPRTPGAGMTTRFPELALIYAINPNKGGQNQKAARGIAKAMGQLASMPDLHLPVARSPFIGLYVELKALGGKATAEQLDVHQALRTAGHRVATCAGVQAALDSILGYLNLPASDALQPYPAWFELHADDAIVRHGVALRVYAALVRNPSVFIEPQLVKIWAIAQAARSDEDSVRYAVNLLVEHGYLIEHERTNKGVRRLTAATHRMYLSNSVHSSSGLEKSRLSSAS